jgi:hypothetical protein
MGINKTKQVMRVWVLYVLPACLGSQFFAARANQVLSGATTTYNGNPACDCSGDAKQCGCIVKT